jgi:hypothetical protein
MVIFIKSPKLQKVTFTDVTLLRSWHSYLLKVRNLDREIVLALNGIVLGFDLNRARLDLEGERRLRLSPPV